jgi:hypothetical protein
MAEDVKARFMPIPPRHQRALEMLLKRKGSDYLGGIGIAALRDEDEPFTLEQIVEPLMMRGLIEDLSETELGLGGRYFVRITRLGEMCLSLGYMLREPRKLSEPELKRLNEGMPQKTAAIEGETIPGTS